MKKILLSLFVFAITFSATAQKKPQASPASKIVQTVGFTDVTVEFSRPSMKGRAIFGELIPFGKVWRTGANQNTKITFSKDVKVGGKDLKAGTYALYTIPNKTSWDVIFYSDATNWGTPKKWDETKVAAKVSTQVQTMPMKIESFTITFDDLKDTGAALGLLWEDTYVGVPFTVN